MQKNVLIILFLLTLVSAPARPGQTAEGRKTEAFAGQSLRMQGRELISYQISDLLRPELKPNPRHIMVFREGFSMSIGTHKVSGDKAVVWLESRAAESGGKADYRTIAYLLGNVSVEESDRAQSVVLKQTVLKTGQEIVVRFDFSGEVFTTADKKETADPRILPFYAEAFDAAATVEPEFTGLKVPGYLLPVRPAPELAAEQSGDKPAVADEKKPQFRYPINLSPLGKDPIKIEWDDVAKTETVLVRFYLWQKQDEEGGLLELQADNTVIFLSGEQSDPNAAAGDVLPASSVQGVYLAGDVVMTEGLRTIRADEIYYNFVEKKALAINAVMRNFDVAQGIPIYVRAAKIRGVAQNRFEAEDITLTTSEFYLPQISINASKIIITDTTTIDEQQGGASKGSYDAQIYDARVKAYDTTIFHWPYMRSNAQRSDIPLKTARVGHDSIWGTTVETRWYLARLLGLQEPEGTDSTLALDYYSKRGFGGGIDTEYAREDYFGRILGYVIHDTGEDRLGRHETRKNLEPPRELRGRFHWQHRQFLPYDWQLTSEVSYASDENFIESFYRSEFNVGKEQETLVHLKRIEDNWGLSFLGKVRINDFVNKLEELPTAEFHWTGQSFMDDKLTFYSDTQLSRFRQRYASSNTAPGSEELFSFATTRNEVDLPIDMGKTKVVPFVAGTVAYEDGAGFYRKIDGGLTDREQNVWFGETGVRVSSQPYWKVFPDVKSELWDLNQLRHLIRPHFTAVAYTQAESPIEQRDTLNAGISQRLQTKRGSGENQRTVDWMRLDLDVTWVNDSGDASAGPDRFIWNRPFIPPINSISGRDRRSSHLYGPRRNYFGADYIWRLSDTTAVLSDMNFDMQSGVVQQYNVGVSHLRWPNLQYYLGSRYLRRLENGLGEKGSNAVTFAITYAIDPRYTVVFSEQVDFDYGATVRSDVTVIRQYHRIYWGLTYSADASLDRQAIVFSIWPQGVRELAFGERRYIGLGSSPGY